VTPLDGERPPSPRGALRFVLVLGAADFLADATYEGGRSIVGPFLGALGAGAPAIAALAGLGEMVGHLLRLASGHLSDRTARPWPIALGGYALNLLSLPSLTWVFHWPVGAVLLVTERMGRGIRGPARDLMLAQAAGGLGYGWAFGLHEALDQLGAVAGPLLVALALYLEGGYRQAFAFLFLPALACLSLLWWARLRYPHVGAPGQGQEGGGEALPPRFWAYVGASALVAAGYADFPLIAFHLEREAVVGASWVPLLYGLAMGVDALAALALGRLFDRVGLVAVALAAALSAPFAPLFFLAQAPPLLALAAAQWGTGIAAQESVMRAAVAALVPPGRRGLAFGLFHSAYGLSWFAGSALMGLLYRLSLPALVAFAAACQAVAAALFLAMREGRPIGAAQAMEC